MKERGLQILVLAVVLVLPAGLIEMVQAICGFVRMVCAKLRYLRFAFFILPFAPAPTHALEAGTAEHFVRDVYAHYRASGSGVPRDKKRGAAFYSSDMLDAFARDQADTRNEGSTIDWDPICNCQDYDLRLHTVTVDETTGGDTAQARAEFTNLGSRHAVDLTLRRTQGGWRIADIRDKGMKSIMILLKEASHAPTSKTKR